MSRFANPDATAVVPLGECQCPGTPHADGDTATVRTELGASALARVGRAELQGAVELDPYAGYRRLILESVLEWTLLWEGETLGSNGNGKPKRGIVAVPINEGTLELMDEKSIRSLAEQIDALTDPAKKGDGGDPLDEPSPESTANEPSRTRTTTRKRGT